MKRYILPIIICLVILFPQIIFSQINLNIKASASNLLRYGSGTEVTPQSATSHKEYFEELGDVRLIVGDFLVGFRYEFDDPIEFGTSVKGFSRRFVEYKKDVFNVRVGNFYELFGKGLTLNAFESRGLGFNTQLDGVKLKVKKSIGKVNVDGTILGGDLNYNDYLVPDRVEHYGIRAANFNVSPIKMLSLGGSYLYTKGAIPNGTNIANMTAEIFEGNLDFEYKSINITGSYANKHTIAEPNATNPNWQAPRGDGGYGALSYTRPSLGLTFDYKNYRFDLKVPNERSTSTSPTKALPFQNAPTCIKEYSWTLLSRYPHQVDFNDEVGFQFDGFYMPNEKLTLNLNGSLSSRHYNYEAVSSGNLTYFQRIERSTSYLPSTDKAFSPYWELYAEAEYYIKKNLRVKLAFARQSSTVYTIENPSSSDIESTTNFPLEIKYDFLKLYSIKFISESQSVYKSLRSSDQKTFFNEYLSCSVSRSPDIILNVSLELSNDKEDPSHLNPNGKIVGWGIVEGTYKFSSANSVTLSYGRERGGLKCTSGICRYVNPFTGFRLMVINNF